MSLGNGLLGVDGYKLTLGPIDIPRVKNELMSESVKDLFTKPQGTMLLEAFEECLPNINSFDEKQHLQFVKAIDRLCHYLKLKQSQSEGQKFLETQSMINNLRQLYRQYRDNNIVIASAILIVMTHIESHDLDDQDARLVHNLTGLHIHRPIQ
ncbi:MAG TPA: hypothetical protein VKG91_03540 [Roseiarcus sp.]|nr:hypothetical protein [Roseiarcus sp.]